MKTFSGLNKEDVIINTKLEDYKKGIDFFFSELVILNTNIYIINKIKEVPFDYFLAHDDYIFFWLVANNFFEYSIVMITRIVRDTGSDSFTLLRFKNRVFNEYIKPEYKDAFKQKLKKARFDEKIDNILERIKDLRNKRIAHTLESFVQNTKDIGRINLQELDVLKEYLNDLFKLISFNIDYMMVPIQYYDKVQHPKGMDSRPDIEKIIDSFIRESGYLTIPEECNKWHEGWEIKKSRMSEKEIKFLNTYRKKFGMEEV